MVEKFKRMLSKLYKIINFYLLFFGNGDKFFEIKFNNFNKFCYFKFHGFIV